MQGTDLDKLLRILVTADDESREAAARALACFGSQAAKELVGLLANPESDARWWASRALAEIGGHDVVLALGDVLQDPDPDVRACAALALGRIRDGSAAPMLATSLADPSAFVAGIAADALCLIGDAAVDALTESLAAEDTHTRLLAVRALSRIRSQRSIGPLFGLLEDPSYLVRYYAQEALEALGVGMVLLAP